MRGPVAASPFGAALMPTCPRSTDRMGALPPPYSSFSTGLRMSDSRCPRCKAVTRVRKIPLVIHVDSMGLVLLRKRCRLCPVRGMLIEHEAEVDRVVDGLASHAEKPPTYLVFGILGS